MFDDELTFFDDAIREVTEEAGKNGLDDSSLLSCLSPCRSLARLFKFDIWALPLTLPRISLFYYICIARDYYLYYYVLFSFVCLRCLRLLGRIDAPRTSIAVYWMLYHFKGIR
jgi:hypothetical protein